MTDPTQADNSGLPPAVATTPPAAQIDASHSSPQTDTGAASAPAGNEPKPYSAVKPDQLPESFWDKDRREPRWGDLNKHLEDSAKFKADIEAARGETPAKAEDYKAELPKEFKLPEGLAELPPGTEFNQNDPRLAILRKIANETGMSQKQFSAVLQMDAIQQSIAVTGRLARDKALGENAAARIGELDTWFKASFDDPTAKQLSAVLYTPEIVKGIEAMKKALTSQGVGNLSSSGRETPEANDGKPPGWDKFSNVDKRTWYHQQQREGAQNARH